jgi:hypothetical protein
VVPAGGDTSGAHRPPRGAAWRIDRPVDLSAVTSSDAYRRGVAQADAAAALAPPESDAIAVSVATYNGNIERDYFKLCRLCGWGRDSGRCPHAQADVAR